VLFVVASCLLFFLFWLEGQLIVSLLFLFFILPVVIFLGKWFSWVRKNAANANFENTMKANLIASTGMNLYFMLLVINNQMSIF